MKWLLSLFKSKPVKPIYFPTVLYDGTMGYRVIWPAVGLFGMARYICFVEDKQTAESIIAWLSQPEGP